MQVSDELERAIRTGKMSRRDFMQRSAALGVGSVAATSLWGQMARAEPVKGGHLNIAIGQGSVGEDLSPLTTGNNYLYVARWAVYNNLVELASDKTPIPELAESWSVSPDAKEWTFNLRQGVEFHNGKPFDADDVLYSINLHRGEDTKSSAKPLLAGVIELTAATPHQVVFKLAEPDAEFVYALADFALVIVPSGHTDWVNAVGTGGYVLESWDAGVKSSFTRNPNYWKDGRAHVDSIDLLTVTDPAARLAAIRSGQAHVIDRVQPRLAAQLEAAGGIQLVRTTSQNYFNSLMRCDEGPLADNEIRLAMKYLLPREQMVKSLLSGFGSVANDHPVPSSDPFFHAELPQRPYDPEKAKFHLKKAGHEGFAVDMYASTAGHTEGVNAAVMMKEAAKAGGVDINVITTPADGYWSDVWMKKPFCISIWGIRPTPAMMMSVAYKSGAPWNDTFFSNARFDELLVSVKSETDLAKRKQIYWDLQEILHNEGGAGGFAFIDTIDAYSDNVGGSQPDSVRDLYGARVCERVWLEA